MTHTKPLQLSFPLLQCLIQSPFPHIRLIIPYFTHVFETLGTTTACNVLTRRQIPDPSTDSLMRCGCLQSASPPTDGKEPISLHQILAAPVPIPRDIEVIAVTLTTLSRSKFRAAISLWMHPLECKYSIPNAAS